MSRDVGEKIRDVLYYLGEAYKKMDEIVADSKKLDFSKDPEFGDVMKALKRYISIPYAEVLFELKHFERNKIAGVSEPIERKL